MDIAVADNKIVPLNNKAEEPNVRVELLQSLLAGHVTWFDAKEHGLNSDELDYIYENDRISRIELVEYIVKFEGKSKSLAYEAYKLFKAKDLRVNGVHSDKIAANVIFKNLAGYLRFLAHARPSIKEKVEAKRKAKEEREKKVEAKRKAKEENILIKKGELRLMRIKKAFNLSLHELVKYIENTPSEYMSLSDLESIGDLFLVTGYQIKSDIPKLVPPVNGNNGKV